MPFHLTWTPRLPTATDLAILAWFVAFVLAVVVLGYVLLKGERR